MSRHSSVLMSALTSFSRPAIASRFPSVPTAKLSTAITRAPPATSASQRWDPTNPAAPVTATVRPERSRLAAVTRPHHQPFVDEAKAHELRAHGLERLPHHALAFD